MKKPVRKVLMVGLKLTIAVGLLAWVLSKAHWHDYVVLQDGNKELSVLSVRGEGASQREYVVTEGRLLRNTEFAILQSQLKPLTDKDGKPVLDAAGRPTYLLPGFQTTLRNLDLRLVAVAMALLLVVVFIMAARWWFLLRLQDIHIRPAEAIRLTFLGNFYNVVVPGTVGGDLIKAYYVGKHTGRTPAVLVSLFVDRVLGMTELTVLAGVMILIVLACGLKSFAEVRTSAIMIMVVVAIVAVAMAFLLSRRFRRLFHLQKVYQRLPIAHHLAAAGDAAALYRRRLPALVKAVGMTFGAHILWVSSLAMLGLSLPSAQMSAVPVYSYFVYIPLIYIIGAIPVAPGGVGLVEGLYVYFFRPLGVEASSILALALLARFAPMLWVLPGMVIAVTGPRLPKAAAMQAELAADEA